MLITKNHYWYQMYVDDLPVWGIVGDNEAGGKLNLGIEMSIYEHDES